MKKTVVFWAACVVAFIIWKTIFSTDTAKQAVSAATASAQGLNAAQVNQIEGIAAEIAEQSNANKHLHLNDMTSSFSATANGMNVRFENVLQVKRGLSQDEVTQWLVETQREIIPATCAQNENNEAFDRGLSYTFVYSSIYGQKLGEVLVEKTTCKTEQQHSSQVVDQPDSLLQMHVEQLNDDQYNAAVNRWLELHPEASSPESRDVMSQLLQEVYKQYPRSALGPALDMALQRGKQNASTPVEPAPVHQTSVPEPAQYRSIDGASPAAVAAENESFARMVREACKRNPGTSACGAK